MPSRKKYLMAMVPLALLPCLVHGVTPTTDPEPCHRVHLENDLRSGAAGIQFVNFAIRYDAAMSGEHVRPSNVGVEPPEELDVVLRQDLTRALNLKAVDAGSAWGGSR